MQTWLWPVGARISASKRRRAGKVSSALTQFPLSSGLSPGQDARLTRWVWTTSCRNWASIMPGLQFPSGSKGAWWILWTRCCRFSSRSSAQPCRTRGRRKAETKKSTEYSVVPRVTCGAQLSLPLGETPLAQTQAFCTVFIPCKFGILNITWLLGWWNLPRAPVVNHFTEFPWSFLIWIFNEKRFLKPLPFLCFPWNTW